MNDFSEIENDLKKLRPAQPSPELFARIEQALRDGRTGASAAERMRSQPKASRYNWWSLGFGLGVAAVLLFLARINTEQTAPVVTKVVQLPSATETRSISRNKFIPAGSTQVVYNALDEGLSFVDGSEAPMRRIRYQTRETLQWRNLQTGGSLRVSYPSEEVVLVPVSGR